MNVFWNSLSDYITSFIPTRTELEVGGIVAIVATCLNHLAGGYDDGLDILLIAMFFDYVTGVIKALLCKEISSAKGLMGLAKKFGMIIAIVMAYQIGRLEHMTVGLDATYVRNAFIYFFIANETISILENLTKMGVPIPKFLPKFLKQYMDKINAEKVLRDSSLLKEKKGE